MSYPIKEFKKVKVMGDGSCYFHAVVGFLDMEKKIKNKKTYYIYTFELENKAQDLRKKVVSWIKKNLNYAMPSGLTIQDEILDELNINNNIKDKSIQGYINYMSKKTSYAGQIEITATSNILKRNINVLIKKSNKYNRIGFGYEINSNQKNEITLIHNMKPGKHEGDHFDILFPISKAEVVSKNQMNSNTKKKSKKKTKVKTQKRYKRTKRKSTIPKI